MKDNKVLNCIAVASTALALQSVYAIPDPSIKQLAWVIIFSGIYHVSMLLRKK